MGVRLRKFASDYYCTAFRAVAEEATVPPGDKIDSELTEGSGVFNSPCKMSVLE